MKNVKVSEVDFVKENVTVNDVFILDLGLDVYQVNINKEILIIIVYTV